jgi:hypothetical protein
MRLAENQNRYRIRHILLFRFLSVPTVRSSLDPGCSGSDIKPSADFTFTFTDRPYDYTKYHLPPDSNILNDSHEKDVKRSRPC